MRYKMITEASWNVAEIWIVFGWYLDGIWMVFGWYLDGIFYIISENQVFALVRIRNKSRNRRIYIF